MTTSTHTPATVSPDRQALVDLVADCLTETSTLGFHPPADPDAADLAAALLLAVLSGSEVGG